MSGQCGLRLGEEVAERKQLTQPKKFQYYISHGFISVESHVKVDFVVSVKWQQICIMYISILYTYLYVYNINISSWFVCSKITVCNKQL